MTLMERIREDLKTAMKNRDSERTGTIRMLLADVKRKEVDTRSEVDEGELVKILRSAVKSRADSVQSYRAGNRPDLADKEEREIEILQVYLPAEIDVEDLKKIVEAAIAETGATSPRDMGQVMKVVMASHGDQVDGRTLSQMVKKLLS